MFTLLSSSYKHFFNRTNTLFFFRTPIYTVYLFLRLLTFQHDYFSIAIQKRCKNIKKNILSKKCNRLPLLIYTSHYQRPFFYISFSTSHFFLSSLLDWDKGSSLTGFNILLTSIIDMVSIDRQFLRMETWINGSGGGRRRTCYLPVIRRETAVRSRSEKRPTYFAGS